MDLVDMDGRTLSPSSETAHGRPGSWDGSSRTNVCSYSAKVDVCRRSPSPLCSIAEPRSVSRRSLPGINGRSWPRGRGSSFAATGSRGPMGSSTICWRRFHGGPNGDGCTTGYSTSRGWSPSTTRTQPLPDPTLASMRGALSEEYRPELGEPFRTVGLCLYRDGNDSVAWHGDTIGRGRTADTLVAIVSLGAPRSFLLRPRGGGPSRHFDVGRGDLLVMGGSCQRTWEHSVPKRSRVDGPGSASSFARPECAETRRAMRRELGSLQPERHARDRCPHPLDARSTTSAVPVSRWRGGCGDEETKR